MIVAVVTLVAVGIPSAATAKPKAADEGLLFAVVGESATLEAGTLTLHGVGDRAVYFTDRPRRITGGIPVSGVAAAVEVTKPPPNAALSGQLPEENEEIVVVLELSEPVFDPTIDELRFATRLLKRATGGLAHFKGRTTDELPSVIDDPVLFVDPVDECELVSVHNNTTVVPLTFSTSDPVVNPSDGSGGHYNTFVSAPTASISPGGIGTFWRLSSIDGCDVTITYVLTGSQASLVVKTTGDLLDGSYKLSCQIQPAGEPFDCSTSKQDTVNVNGP
jgi:hypothetical protein